MPIDTGARGRRQTIGPSHVTGPGQQSPLAHALRRVSRASTTGQPAFRASEEGSRRIYPVAYALNRQYATPGPYQTSLNPLEELAFRTWANTVHSRTGIRIPTTGKTDYDYRGFFKASGGKVPKGHYPDRFKTPYDTRFSGQSQYATPQNPLVWHGERLVNRLTGMVVG